MEKLAGAVAGAQVDLNPHQVDAALFAFNSPLSKGALLADEVGLGKTIEAGIVISQRWAERKRRILISCNRMPSSSLIFSISAAENRFGSKFFCVATAGSFTKPPSIAFASG
jgi:hypothetical protein